MKKRSRSAAAKLGWRHRREREALDKARRSAAAKLGWRHRREREAFEKKVTVRNRDLEKVKNIFRHYLDSSSGLTLKTLWRQSKMAAIEGRPKEFMVIYEYREEPSKYKRLSWIVNVETRKVKRASL